MKEKEEREEKQKWYNTSEKENGRGEKLLLFVTREYNIITNNSWI